MKMRVRPAGILLRVRGAAALTLFFVCALFSSHVAHSSSVFVQAGTTEGQGYAFRLGKLCMVFTALHVVSDAKQVELVSPKGERTLANVVGRNSSLDLALLELLADRGRPLPTLCVGESSMPLDVPVWIQQAGPRSQVALQRVPSRAGAVDHVPVQAGNLDGASPYFHIKPASADAIAQGDSGATVWINNGAPRPNVESNGTLIGMAVAVENGLVRVLRADFIQQAVYSMLWPVDMSKIRFATGQGSNVQMAYGTVPRVLPRGRPQALSWSTGAATVHFIIDLGDRDTTVEGVSVSRGVLQKMLGDLLKSLVAQAGPAESQTLRMRVQTSQLRPAETGAWLAERCMKPDVRGPINPCQFPSAKVVRGITVELTGDISRISELGLYLSR
jgi:hypothetical protein